MCIIVNHFTTEFGYFRDKGATTCVWGEKYTFLIKMISLSPSGSLSLFEIY